MTRVAQWILFAALGSATLTAWCEGPWTVCAMLAAVLSTAVALRMGAGAFHEPSPRAQLSLGILSGIVLWALAQALFGWSVAPEETVAAATRWCAMAGIFFACTQAFSGQATRWMERFSLFAGGIAILSLLERYTSGGRFLWIWESGYLDIYGPFASYMDHAVLMELAFPFALLAAVEQRRPACAAAAALMMAAVVMSASRAGSLLLIAEALVVFAMVAARQPRRRMSLAPAMAASVVLAAALSAAAGWDRLAGRMSEARPFEFRRNVLQSALDMIRERPLAGFGMGNFPTAYPAYARFDDGTRVNHAHNEWAEWAAEGGLPMALAMAVLAACAVRPAIRTVWGIGLLAVLLHAVIDYPLRRCGAGVWFFFVLAAAHSAPLHVPSRRRALNDEIAVAAW